MRGQLRKYCQGGGRKSKWDFYSQEIDDMLYHVFIF